MIKINLINFNCALYPTLILFNCLIAESKYPADSLLSSEKTPTIYKLGLLPIAGWQRISYNTNFFNCQFYPSCSNYGAHAIGKYGIIRGGVIASDRIHPLQSFCENLLPYRYKPSF